MGVDHRRLDVLVAEELLDGADVVSGHEQVGGERVAEGVTAGFLGDAGFADRGIDCFSDDRLVQMVATNDAGSRILAVGAGGKDVLPTPVGGGVGVLSVKGLGEVHSAEAVGEVALVDIFHLHEMVLETLTTGFGEEGGSVFVALAVADGDVSEVEVEVLDSESEALEDPHPGAVKEQDDELCSAFEAGENRGDLVLAEDGGEPFWLPGADYILEPGGLELEDVAVEEEDGAAPRTAGPLVEALPAGAVSKGAGRHALQVMCFAHRGAGFRQSSFLGDARHPSRVLLTTRGSGVERTCRSRRCWGHSRTGPSRTSGPNNARGGHSRRARS